MSGMAGQNSHLFSFFKEKNIKADLRSGWPDISKGSLKLTYTFLFFKKTWGTIVAEAVYSVTPLVNCA